MWISLLGSGAASMNRYATPKGRRSDVRWQEFIKRTSGHAVPHALCKICNTLFKLTYIYRHVRSAHGEHYQAVFIDDELHRAASDVSSESDDAELQDDIAEDVFMDVDDQEQQPNDRPAARASGMGAPGAAASAAVAAAAAGAVDAAAAAAASVVEIEVIMCNDAAVEGQRVVDTADEQDAQEFVDFWDEQYHGDWEGSSSDDDTGSSQNDDCSHDASGGSDSSDDGTGSGTISTSTTSDSDTSSNDGSGTASGSTGSGSTGSGSTGSGNTGSGRGSTGSGSGSTGSGSTGNGSTGSGSGSTGSGSTGNGSTGSGSASASASASAGSGSSSDSVSDSDHSIELGTVQWYQENMDTPVWPGSTVTLRQMLYDDFRDKRAFNISDKAFDAQCKRKSKGGHLPPGNIYPPSLHLARGAIGAGSWQQYHFHVCGHPSCTGWVYPQLQPNQYEQHQNDRCRLCREPRFKRVRRGRRWTYVARWWYIDFGLERVLSQFFQNPDWVAAYDEGIPSSADDLRTRSTIATAAAAAVAGSSMQAAQAAAGHDNDDGCDDDDDHDDGSLWSGTEIRRLLQDCGINLLEVSNGAWELCLDWVRVFKTVSYSVGVLGIRDAKRNNMVRSKQLNYKILAVLPGPSIPPNLRPYLMRTLYAFKRLSLGPGAGMQVNQVSADVHGNRTIQQIQHKPYMVGFHADAPARQKAAAWLAVSAYLACGWCIFRALRLLSASGNQHVYPTGYQTGVPQPARRGNPSGTAMLVGDSRLQLTDAEQMARALRVSAKSGTARKQAASDEGCSGLSIIPQLLPYVSYKNVWVAPVIHMLLYGVVADFLRHILHTKGSKSHAAASRGDLVGDDAAVTAANVGVLSQEQKRIISQRAAHIQLTSDFGRGYRDVVENLNSMKMEELLHFVESIAPIVFRDEPGKQVLPPITRTLWNHLRSGVLHYCRPPTDEAPFTPSARQQGAQHMREYARLLHAHDFPGYMFTWNLHWAVCRLPGQEAARGSTGADAEWWTERLMQVYKEVVGDRVSHKTEQVFANTALVDQAIDRMRLLDPTLADRDQHISSDSSFRLAHNEDPGDSSGCQLIGKGRRPFRGEKPIMLAGARRFVVRHPQLALGWTEQQVELAFQQAGRAQNGKGVLVFQRADKADDEMVSTDSYAKTVSRQNFYIQVSWQGGRGIRGDRRRPFVARIRYLLWLRHPNNIAWSGSKLGQQLTQQQQGQLNRDLRLALVDLYAEPTAIDGVLRVANKQQLAAADTLRPIAVSQIDAKLVVCEPPDNTEILCSRYSNMSKLR